MKKMIKNKREFLNFFLDNNFVRSIVFSPIVDYHQWFILKFIKTNAKKMKSNDQVIDIGAGELKYKKYFDHCNYKSQDLCVGDTSWDFSKIDIRSSAYDIPFKDSYFDYILCTQVMEHLEFPDKAFSEFNRLLKIGGKVILTAPLGFGEHQIPYDFFRYTQYGLKSLGDNHGFRLIYIEPQGGIFINLEYVLWRSIFTILPFKNIFPIWYIYYVALLPLKMLSGIMFIMLDLFDKKKTYTLNYNCIYERIR